MSGTPTLYCSTCRRFRAIEDWRERDEALVIQLTPCRHLLYRSAAIEWTL